jgi:hypothetical protein
MERYRSDVTKGWAGNLTETASPLTKMLDATIGDLIAPARTFSDRFAVDGIMEFPYSPIIERVTGPRAIAVLRRERQQKHCHR